MNVLVACEESQRVCMAFRERGHTAWSCDIQPCSGGHPEWHILGDCIPLLNGNCEFTDEAGGVHLQNGKWDLLIAHPPCTYLTVTANRWYDIQKYGDEARERFKERYKAIVFFMRFVLSSAERIAVENPIGIMNTAFRKPDCIVHPYYFGDPVSKATCLWLKNLPPLVANNVVEPEKIPCAGHGAFSGPSFAATDETGKRLAWDDPRTAVIRSKTYPGIAKAMAEQWGTCNERACCL